MKIAVLTSGGVDSSVALSLLKEQGHEVKAFYLKIWLEDELQYLGSCPWEEDLKYVEEICENLKVPLEIVPMQKEYFDRIISYTIEEVKAGLTPNPDVLCNNHIKFGVFLEKKNEFNFDKVASGHYAQVFERNGRFLLKKSPDLVKDQTYFLCNLSQEQLSKIVFPIGHLSKEEVRNFAKIFNLPNQNRKDSQGLCFLGKIKFKEFIKHHLGEKKGDIVEFETGRIVGEHPGFWYYTLGQRHGLDLGGGPFYVVKKDIEKNIIYISSSYHSEDKKRNNFFVHKLNWFEGYMPKKRQLQIKVRHGEKIYNCGIMAPGRDALPPFVETSAGKQCVSTGAIHVKLDENDQGIASGQFAVFYDGEECLGGGVIK